MPRLQRLAQTIGKLDTLSPLTGQKFAICDISHTSIQSSSVSVKIEGQALGNLCRPLTHHRALGAKSKRCDSSPEAQAIQNKFCMPGKDLQAP
jgi:hypothetical protein